MNHQSQNKLTKKMGKKNPAHLHVQDFKVVLV
jgi:hypothetical protein